MRAKNVTILYLIDKDFNWCPIPYTFVRFCMKYHIESTHSNIIIYYFFQCNLDFKQKNCNFVLLKQYSLPL